MTQKLLTLPFRVGFSAARTALDVSAKTLDISVKLAGTAVEILRPGGGHSGAHSAPAQGPPARRPPAQTPPTPQAPPRPSAQPDRATEPERSRPADRAGAKPRRPTRADRVNGHSAAAPAASPTPAPPPSPAPVTPPDEQPPTPLSHEQQVVKTLADEEELVAEFAEPGAEGGAGAQLDVEEPWEGYAQMNASTIIARIDQAGSAELALLELYEQTHKKRQTVLGAASKRLRALSPPESE